MAARHSMLMYGEPKALTHEQLLASIHELQRTCDALSEQQGKLAKRVEALESDGAIHPAPDKLNGEWHLGE